MRLLSLLIVLCLITTATLSAETTLLKANLLLDVNTGKVIKNASVLITDNLISAINPKTIPDGTTTIDLGDNTLMPGMIDNHVHLTLDSSNFSREILTDNASTAAIKGSINARKTLMAGFTAVRDVAQIVPSLELVTVSLADASDKGLIAAPRIIAVGHALSISGGHIDPAMSTNTAEGILDLSWKYGVADGVDEVLKATRYQIKHGAKAIKIAATAGVLSLESSVGAQQYSYEEMKTIVDEAARHGLKVAAHAHGTVGIKAAIKAGVASIEHGSLLDDEAIKMMKSRGTYLVATTALVDTIDLSKLPKTIQDKAHYVLPLAVKSVSRAIKKHVKMALGTDAPLVPHGQNALEAVYLVKRGMTNLEAIQAATINGADLIGIDKIGQIKSNYLADIIAVKGNPLDDINALMNVEFVMKNGVIYKN